MNITKELVNLKKLIENRNFGEQLALGILVDIFIEYFKKGERKMKKKNKFKVGDLVILGSWTREIDISRFKYGVVEDVGSGIIKVQREDINGVKYKGHEQKWWHSGHWQLC